MKDIFEKLFEGHLFYITWGVGILIHILLLIALVLGVIWLWRFLF